MEIQVKQEVDDDIKECDISHTINPWDVTDASVFLKYCCPECDFQSKGLSQFGEHALSNHDRSSVLFKL